MSPFRTQCLLACVAGLIGITAQAGDLGPADPETGRDHWAFTALLQTRPAVERNWSRSRIDEFVFERRAKAGLKPAPDASPDDLLRRASFLLTGLPPTAKEMAAFANDSDQDAFERFVDRLLASPQFGERWGRHWLDLARYADSNGLDENFLFREAWRYRNWVIDAMNTDLPFDRFVLEQIAGDKLPYESIAQRDRQRIGAGFLVIGPKVLLGVKPGLQKMDVADEQLDTIGRTFLGLTVGCARCHDHKSEPIPTRDYYAMAGIFTSTEVMERRYMLGQQRKMERLVGLGGDGEKRDDAYEHYWREVKKKREAAKRARTARDFLKKKDNAGLLAFAKKNPKDVAKGAGDSSKAFEQRIAAQNVLIAGLDKFIADKKSIPPRAMIPADAESPADEAIRKAGAYNEPGDSVPRGFLQVISRSHQPTIAAGSSGRIELAEWLTDTENGAGRLTARVLANRIWHHLIGRGLVRTVDNFGRTGEAPSNPELLDYLAGELIRSDWSIKSLVRQIALSRTFAMSTEFDERAGRIDPENILLWRAHRRRLDPESLRDAMLLAADKLELAHVNSTVSYLGDQATAVGANKNRRRTDIPHRSVYLPMIRNDLPEIFEAFDFADPHSTTGARPLTTAATQSLFMLNDKSVADASGAIAERLFDLEPDNESRRVQRLFNLLLGEAPTNQEQALMLAFLRKSETKTKDTEAPGKRAWALAVHALLSSSRFQFLD